MKRIFLLLCVIIFSATTLFPQQKKLLIRCDDMGMSHSVNMAIEKVLQTGIPVSVSVMFPCPWNREAVEILKKYENASAGVHLTLNSEWRNYKWGPVLGKSAVPTLVDEDGYFFPSRSALFANNPSTAEVEKELRAQVERAFRSGLKIDYFDYHMGTAMDKPEYRDIVEKLADEYKVGISRYFNEFTTNNMYDDPPQVKADSLWTIVNNLKDSVPNLLVCHIGIDTPELAAMEDMNSFGLKEMSVHRNAELNALLSERIQKFIHSDAIKLIKYSDLKDQQKIRPEEFKY